MQNDIIEKFATDAANFTVNKKSSTLCSKYMSEQTVLNYRKQNKSYKNNPIKILVKGLFDIT